ncbi:MAG TPA: hypothetical protein VGV35_16960 [Bryobacteraceae bacterium]|nr:hypothetical protein [Bryobacteraceae bacterium]
MKRSLCTLLGTGLLCAAFQLAAQPPTDPPRVIRIFREDIKEGRGPAHEKTEAKWAQLMTRAKYPNNSLGMTSLTGPSQAWFVEAHESFASIGEAEAFFGKSPAIKAETESLDSQDAEYRSGSRNWIAVYRPEMSFHPKQLVESLPKARYFNVITFRVRQGHDQDFEDIAKTAVAALEKSAAEQAVVTYQLVSGGPNGTYLLFEPMASLKSVDEAAARGPAFAQAMGDSGMKKFLKAISDTIVSEDFALFTINPKMSYVSKEFAAGDPDFWTPKTAKTAAPAKPAAKTSAKK